MTPAQESQADRVAATVNASGYQLQVTSSGFTNINLTATPEGAYASALDTINVKTNAPGYYLYLSTNDNTADSNKLYLDGNTASTSFFAATAGTHAAPATLSSNSWGYAVAGEDNFDSTYATPTPLITSKWAAVPVKGQEQLIHTATAANQDPGDNINVYYGAKANLSMPAGVYSNTVTYTAVVSSTPQDVADVSPSRLNGLNGGQTITISTSLNATSSSVGTITVNIGDYACTNPVASNSASGSVIITCIAPANDSGTYDVSVDIAGYSKTYYIANAIEYYHFRYSNLTSK